MAAAQLVVDTDIIIDYLRQRSTLFREASSNFDCAITAISLYELRAVPHLSDIQLNFLQQLRQLVEVLPFDSNSADQAAELWRTLASKGQGIGLADTLIAGICLANDLPLLTRNIEHYSRIPALKLISGHDLLSQIHQP